MTETKFFSRFMICAPSSGSGKTLITCAILRILARKGYAPSSYKCGPDYIDPMFHNRVLGIPSRNLDVFLMGETGVMKALRKGAEGRNIGVLEGVMGFYDGIRADSAKGSSSEICSITGTPAIIVVSCGGMSRSVIPLVKGFCDYDSRKLIRGIILNNISSMVAGSIKRELEEVTGVPVIGMLPKLTGVSLESRHLGLKMPSEIPEILDEIDKVADRLEESLDFNAMIEIARTAPGLEELDETKELLESGNGKDRTVISGKPSFEERGNALGGINRGDRIGDGQELADRDAKTAGGQELMGRGGITVDRQEFVRRVGIAMDEAFCFYYEDNLDLLREMGAELVPFSPINDKKLPEVSGIIVGGGYPELYAKVLSENISMREDILSKARAGMPVLAECGGFLYLQESICDPKGQEYEMVGLFQGKGCMQKKLQHFGYVTMSAAVDNPYLKEGEEIRAHEFHYYDTSCNGETCLLKKPSGTSWSGYQSIFNSFGGFAHLYYPSNPAYIKRFMVNYSAQTEAIAAEDVRICKYNDERGSFNEKSGSVRNCSESVRNSYVYEMKDQKSFRDITIDEPDKETAGMVRKRWDALSKPIDGFGDFESIVCRIGAIQRKEIPSLSKRAVLIFCADNGIVEEGVSQSGSEITLSVARALGSGISSACCLARHAKLDVIPVDIGIDCDEEIEGVRNLKAAKGTRDFFREPAMSESETILAIEHGIELVKELSDEGYTIIATGEMGIGNTTTATAVLSALLGIDSEKITGRGAGLSDEGLYRKRKVIRESISKYSFDSIDDPTQRAFMILRTLGGLDIAALTGVFIGGAMYHVPIVIDGLITSTAALTAEKLVPGVREYMIPSHRGREEGNAMALEALELESLLGGKMALGEGTGAILLFPVLDAILDYYEHGAMFSDYSIEEYKRFEQ